MTKLNRRSIFRILGSSILLFLGLNTSVKAATKAKTDRIDVSLEGEWASDENRPCAIFKQGRVLLVINHLGSIGTAHMLDSSNLIVVGGVGWDAGLRARILNSGKRIEWSNNTSWAR